MSALTKPQKSHLVQLAQRAFKLTGAKARGAGFKTDVLDAPDKQTELIAMAVIGSALAFNVWRHEHVALACGKAGLRCCTQLDYKLVEAHFLELLGETGKAMNALVQAQSEPKRQAEARLIHACKTNGFKLSYAETLCQSIHKVSLGDAPTAVIWKVIYTINNRGAAKRRNQKEAA